MENKKPIVTYNIREERMKKKETKTDKVLESAKKHFEEIFNRR